MFILLQETLSMRRLVNRLGRTALLAGCAALALCSTACDSNQNRADRAVRQKLVQSARLAAASQGPSPQVYQLLTEAVQVAADSPAAAAAANAFLANEDHAAALGLMDELRGHEAAVHHQLALAQPIVAAIASATFVGDAFAALDPQGKPPVQPLAAYQQHISNLRAQIEKLNQSAAATEAAIVQKTAQVARTEQDHRAALAEATDLVQRSEQAGGRESVDLFKQSLEAREKAAHLSHTLALQQAELAQLQTTLREIQGHKALAEAAIATAQDQIKSLQAGWSQTQEAIQKQAVASRSMLESGLVPRAADLNAALEKSDPLRRTVLSHLTRSIAAYDAAITRSETARQEVVTRINRASQAGATDRPGHAALVRLRELYSPTVYELARAKVLSDRAAVHMAEKLMLESIAKFAEWANPILARAGLKLPAGMVPADLKQRIDAAAKNAQSDLDRMREDLTPLLERQLSGPDRTSARVLLMHANYALYCLNPANQAALAAARSAAEALAKSEEASALPPMPASLWQAPPLELPATPTTKTTASGAVGDEAAARAAAIQFYEAIERGDTAALRLMLHGTETQNAMHYATAAALGASRKLESALISRFGQAGRDFVARLKSEDEAGFPDRRTQLATAPAVKKGPGEIQFIVKGPEDTDLPPVAMIYVDGQWKIDSRAMAGPNESMNQLFAGFFQERAKAIEQLAEEIAAGKYATLDQVRAAMEKQSPP
jgi:hypothetical protein